MCTCSEGMTRRQAMKSVAAMAAAFAAGSLLPTDWARAADGKNRKVLFFTKSSGFQHDVIKRKSSDELSFAEKILVDLGKQHGFDVTATRTAASSRRKNSPSRRDRLLHHRRPRQARQRPHQDRQQGRRRPDAAGRARGADEIRGVGEGVRRLPLRHRHLQQARRRRRRPPVYQDGRRRVRRPRLAAEGEDPRRPAVRAAEGGERFRDDRGVVPARRTSPRTCT